MTDEPGVPLRAIAELLDRAAIPYMVVGSFASMAHGIPRTTQVSKLEWSKASNSERQLLDVAGILRVRSVNLDLDYIELAQ